MKKIILSIALLAASFACKKESPTPVTPTPPTKIVSAKVNGVEQSCTMTCYSGYNSNGSRGVTLYISDSAQIRFFCSELPAAGTYTLSKSNFEPSMMYQKDFVYYKASVGTLNITSIDTSKSGVIDKIQASFNFQTDTSNGVFFNISEGTINLK